MADIITRLKFETDEFHNRARRVTTEINNISQQLEKSGVRVDHMNAKNLKLAQSFGQMQTVSTTLRGKISELSEEFVAWSHHYNQITEEQRRSPYGKAIVQQLDILKQRIHDTKGELAGIEGSLNGKMGGAGFGKQLLNGLVPGLGAGLAMAGVMAATKAMRAFKEQAIDTVKVNMEFEQSNANLSAILGKNIEDIGALTENAKMLGATTVYTAGQISELQTVLARRGFNQDQILNMTHGISNLAVATGTDLAESAELAASTMQAFGLKATDMERIVSVLGVSTTKSALTTQALGTSLQYVAPTARAAGFSLEDTVAMLGALVDSGLDASTAGTSLRQIILGMSTANGKLANSFGHPIRGLKDMTESIRKMKENGGSSLDEISKKVRVTAVPAFLSLVENVDRLDALRESITGVEDELQNMADKQINTLKGSTILLKSAWDGLKLSFSESNGTIKSTIDLLTKLINKVTEARRLDQGGQGAVDALLGDEEEFKKRVAKRAKEWVSEWNTNQEIANREGGSAWSLPNSGWGVTSGVTLDRNVSQYNSAIEEANAELKKQEEIYKKLIPLSEKYAKHQTSVIVAGSSVTGTTNSYVDPIHDEVIADIKKISGRSFKSYDNFVQYLKRMYEDISMYKSIVTDIGGADNLTGTLVDDEVTGGTTGTVTIVERARDIVDKALLRYKQELQELQNRLRVGLIDQAEFDKRKVGLDENVWEAYGRADMKEPSQEFKAGIAKWAKVMGDDADIAAMSNGFDKLVKAEDKFQRALELAAMMEEQGLQDSIAAKRKELSALESLWNTYAETATDMNDADIAGEAKELAERIKGLRNVIKELEDELKRQREKQSIYNRALRSIESTARGNNIRYADIEVKGFQELINNNQMTDGMMEDAVKKLNEQLKTKGIRWTVQLDLETGTLEKLKSRLDEVFEGIGKGTGGVKNIVGALDSVKKAGESMVDTLRGDADGWDKMIAVLNAAMSPLEATVTIYEAINALTEMGNILKAQRVASKTAEAAAEVTGTQAEVAAETEKIAVDKVATKAATELATAEYMAAHAAIPFTGFEIGAGFAEASLAVIKATGAAVLAFHDGGRVPGAYNGGRDTVPALLSPGEIILNRAQQKTLAPQLVAPKWGMDGGSVQFIQRGTDLIGVINATVASKGGVKTHKIYQH